MIYPSIRIEGNIISQEILSRLEEGDCPGQNPKDFGFGARTRVKDEIAFAWATAKDHWRIFQRKLDRLAEDATATTETRAEWMKPLLGLLGYQVELARAEVLNDKTYAISHRDLGLGGFPIHVMGYRDELDKKRAEGGPRMSPHGLLQEYLNSSIDLYGLVSNGHYLRLLRDSGRLVKLSFAEFDLMRMMEDDLYADFATMYRLLHRSRMPSTRDLGAESLIERYHQDSIDAGSRIRERLSHAVEQSIILLANGFLRHPSNDKLRTEIEGNRVIPEIYYQRLLRLIYRFLFLMVTEERDLVFTDLNQSSRNIYYNYYSVQRLRKLSERIRFDEGRFDDLWEGLKTTFRFFEKREYGDRIGILPLDGDLFGADALGEIDESRLKNDILLECIRDLSEFSDDKGVRIRVNYGSLDVEEFGSVYEGLLEYDPSLTQTTEGWHFQFVKGDKRSSSGSHYTPDELVQPLIKHSLDHVIEEKLKAGSGLPDKESARTARRSALLSIKVCDVACGSGHILLSAARRIATVLAQVVTDEEQPSPTSFRVALREVIRHCIYGVDKNPLAVELCKVALWLEAHNPGMPLTFLDHRIRCGDSIVGLARREEIERGISTEAFKTLPGDDKDVASMCRKANKAEVEARLARQEVLNYETEFATELRTLVSKANELQEQKDDTVEDFHRKREFYSSMQGTEYWRLKNIADLQVAQFFTPKTLEKKESLATDATYFNVVHNKCPSLGNYIYNSTALSSEKGFFHWFLEFPEVFAEKGFDCILGNPPFLGNKKISGTFGDDFIQYVKISFQPAGSVDLVTYFFRRAFDLLRQNGLMGLISTNTISQGDAREGGLGVILSQQGTINFAIRSMKWPGLAAVDVALVTICKGEWTRQCVLSNNDVGYISSFLDDSENSKKPFTLNQNENISFVGSFVLGSGFKLNPNEAETLIKNNKQNEDVVFPYIIGDDINSDPIQKPSRWVINFFDWPLDRTAEGKWSEASVEKQNEWLQNGVVPKDYPNKVASDYPDCLDIIDRLVKPERQRKDANGSFILRKPLPQKWWIYADKRPALYKAIQSLGRTLVVAKTSKYIGFVFVPSSYILDQSLTIVASNALELFCVVQSSLNDVWAKAFGTTHETRYRYNSECFATLPLPQTSESHDKDVLQALGSEYQDMRSRITKLLAIGITKAYNLFHDPILTPAIVAKESKQSLEIAEKAYHDIVKLRQLHEKMDGAVLAAYGWNDVDLEHGFHEVEYLPENDRVRYTISEKARKEVLRRLLKLNHQIHEEEVERGLWAEKSGKPKKKKVVILANQEVLGL